MPADIAELLNHVRQVADELYPGHRGCSVRIVHAHGAKTTIQVPPTGGPKPLGEMAQNVLTVLETLDVGETMTGEEISVKAGYKYSGSFRVLLAEMVKSGHIRNMQPGYAL